MSTFNYKKATQVINFFARKEDGFVIDKLKVIKLIWLSDRLHLRRYGRLITNDNYYAMIKGPVPSLTKDLIQGNDFPFNDLEMDYRNTFINLKENINVYSLKELDHKIFSNSDIKIMEEIYSDYGKFENLALSDFSHEFPEWKRHEESIRHGERRVKMEFMDFFENAPVNATFPTMNQDKDFLELSKELFFERNKK